jgi:hypothetical protein
LQGEVAAGVAPAQAKVIGVFGGNEVGNPRLIFMQIPAGIEDAMSQLHKLYTQQGWAAPDPLVPQRQPDQGWLQRFTRQGQERIVYARPMKEGAETPKEDAKTLVAVYDSPH